MRLEIVRTTDDFEKLHDAWNALLARSDSRSIFLTWEWLYSWWRHFGNNRQLHIMVLRDDDAGELCGILPLCVERICIGGMLPLRKLQFLGADKVSSDFLDFIAVPEKLLEILDVCRQYFAENGSEWDVIELSDLDEGTLSLQHLRVEWGNSFTMFEQPASICPYLSLAGDFDSFLQSLSSNMRYNLKRKLRKFESNGSLTLRTGSEQDDLNGQFDQLFQLHREGFRVKINDKPVQSSFSGDDIRHFHYDVIRGFARNNWIKMYFAGDRSRAIGCIYTFRYKGRSFFYQSGFDRTWDQWSVGTVLVSYCIKESIRDGLDEFHYLRGAEAYKFRWTEKVIKTRTIILVNKTLPAMAYSSKLHVKTVLKTLKTTLNSMIAGSKTHV